MPYKNPTSSAAKASLKRRRKRYFETHGGYTEATRNWPSRLPREMQNRYYKHQHGVTLDGFEAQIQVQKGLCPIGNHPLGQRGKTKGSPCQDHDHETDENRDVICREHNVGLGCFHDSIEELESAIEYLKKHRTFS